MEPQPTLAALEAKVLKLQKVVRQHQAMGKLLHDEIARWRRLIEQSRDGIVILDQHGKVYEANKRYADMLGYSSAEVNQLHIWDWDFQFSREQLLAMLRAVDDSGDHFETQHRRKDGRIIDVEISTNGAPYGEHKLIFCICRDITDRKLLEKQRQQELQELQKALAEIKVLKEILPICSYCKKIRDDKGYWEKLEVYIQEHGGTSFSHGVCPECARKHHPDVFED